MTMLTIYHITFTEDCGETYRRLAVPATNLTNAYVEIQMRYPNAEITNIEHSGKIITIQEAV